MTGAAAPRHPLAARAFATMVVLCMLWGLQQVAVKWAIPEMSPVMQGGVRSIIAAACLAGWMAVRRIPLFERDGTLAAGLFAGTLFAIEFLFIYAGLPLTNASRMSVFLYLAPPLTALGLHLFVPGERLVLRQWLGIALAFAGIAVAFGDGFVSAKGQTVVGDLFGVIAAALWAATTVLIRSTRLSSARAEKTLFYQLGMSALVLPVASIALGEAGLIALTPALVANLAYQSIVVAFASFLAWFWLLTRYLASRITVFSFLTPLFGVLFGVLLLGEAITPPFVVAALLVGSGIALVNRR